jgi:hypothetical protein
MSEVPTCLTPASRCPKTVPMLKLDFESSLTREVYYCPLCGSARERSTAWEQAGRLGSIAVGLSAVVSVAVILLGELPDSA